MGTPILAAPVRASGQWALGCAEGRRARTILALGAARCSTAPRAGNGAHRARWPGRRSPRLLSAHWVHADRSDQSALTHGRLFRPRTRRRIRLVAQRRAQAVAPIPPRRRLPRSPRLRPRRPSRLPRRHRRFTPATGSSPSTTSPRAMRTRNSRRLTPGMSTGSLMSPCRTSLPTRRPRDGAGGSRTTRSSSTRPRCSPSGRRASREISPRRAPFMGTLRSSSRWEQCPRPCCSSRDHSGAAA